MRISIIVAFDENRLIGKDNGLPWHLPADLKHFKNITMGHHMVMGRKTFESIGKPLPGRTNVVVTSNPDWVFPDCISAPTIPLAIEACGVQEEIFLIGGAGIFKEGLMYANRLLVTLIHHRFEGDTYFPEIDLNEWKETSREPHMGDEKNPWNYTFIEYLKK